MFELDYLGQIYDLKTLNISHKIYKDKNLGHYIIMDYKKTVKNKYFKEFNNLLKSIYFDEVINIQWNNEKIILRTIDSLLVFKNNDIHKNILIGLINYKKGKQYV